MEQGWAAHMALVGVEALRSLAHGPHSHSAVEKGQILSGLCPLLDSIMDVFGDWTTLGEAFVSPPIRRAKIWVAERDLELLGHVLDKFLYLELLVLNLDLFHTPSINFSMDEEM
ncbi:uncharacterized [Tachysurus ichikawai]